MILFACIASFAVGFVCGVLVLQPEVWRAKKEIAASRLAVAKATEFVNRSIAKVEK